MLIVPLGVAGCLAAFRLSRSAMEGELAWASSSLWCSMSLSGLRVAWQPIGLINQGGFVWASSSLCCSMSLSGLRVAWQPIGLNNQWGDSYGLQEIYEGITG
ncbi:hypothetical protein DPMN_059883 [Dreissena polymorpha]|uniref:Uncharacterized protein n=1 Tax=Dreissena polymorpha TaxID=45954 RepID=A0A9D4C4U6_DREPO|nr:hypothetical protein DPMN_059883 [Dreissena polymorpha]